MTYQCDGLRPTEQKGWRGWVPLPEITAQRITVANPPDSQLDGNMAEINNLQAVINPLALLHRTVELPRLQIEQANVLLSRDAQEVNNWTFTENDRSDQTSSAWQFNLQQLQLSQAKIHVIDIPSKLDLNAELDTLQEENEAGYRLGFTTNGTYNDATIKGEGQTGDVLSLTADSAPFPLQGKVSVGETLIGIEGSLTRPQQLAALDVQLSLAGNSMADLHALLGVALPNTPPYNTKGRLIATLDGDHDRWRYENFKGVVGESDLNGTLEYQIRDPRPLLTGTVESQQLRFRDLGPLIGADTSDVKGSKDKNAVAPPAGQVLPVDPISAETWGTMDADVNFKGRKILRNENLPLNDIEAYITLQDRVLSFTPLNFGVAGGTLHNTITLNGQGEKLQAEMDTAARHLKLKELFPGAESMDASFGELHGDATLSGQGNSIAELLGHANGEINALVSRGTVSHFLMEAAGLNVANMIFLKLFGDEQVILNCVAANANIRNGLLQIGLFTLETEDTTVDVTGDINLRSETLNLDIRPANKTLRIFTLRSPLYATGTFQNPDIGVQTGPLAARTGAAVALGVVATPLAALLPLLNTGTNDATDCEPVAGEQDEKPNAAQAEEAPKPENATEHWPSTQAKP